MYQTENFSFLASGNSPTITVNLEHHSDSEFYFVYIKKNYLSMSFQGNLASLVGTLLGIVLLTLLIVAAVLAIFILRNKRGKNNNQLSEYTLLIVLYSLTGHALKTLYIVLRDCLLHKKNIILTFTLHCM